MWSVAGFFHHVNSTLHTLMVHSLVVTLFVMMNLKGQIIKTQKWNKKGFEQYFSNVVS